MLQDYELERIYATILEKSRVKDIKIWKFFISLGTIIILWLVLNYIQRMGPGDITALQRIETLSIPPIIPPTLDRETLRKHQGNPLYFDLI